MAIKHPNMAAGLYSSNLSMQTVSQILEVRNSKFVSGIEHKLFDFPVEMIEQSIKERTSIRNIIKRDNIDYMPYVGRLRDYQTVGTAFMYISPRSIIADGVGLGKTAQVSALLNILKERKQMYRFFMCVESSAVGQTWYELIRYTGLNVIKLPSTKARMMKCINDTNWNEVDGIIAPHSVLVSDTFYKWLSLNKTDKGFTLFDTFILDESYIIKNDSTKRYNYIKEICGMVNRVHFMNATVFETRLLDVYYQLDVLDSNLLPEKRGIGKYMKYEQSSFYTRDWNGRPKINKRFKVAGYKNQSEFKKSIELVYFGRSKEEVGLENSNEYKVYEVEATEKQLNAISAGYRYNEMLNCPSSNMQDETGITISLKDIPKMRRLVELAENDFYSERTMIYCFHINAQIKLKEELEKIGKRVVILNGKDTSVKKDENRLKIINDFNKGEYDIIITNIQRSLNLYSATVCILYSLETNPSKGTQITGRIDRNVDNKSKTFVLMLYKNTPEETFYKTVVGQREEDSRSLTIDAKGSVSHFMASMIESEE